MGSSSNLTGPASGPWRRCANLPQLRRWLAIGLLALTSNLEADNPPLAAGAFESTLRNLRAAGTDAERIESAKSLLRRHVCSSLQVKAVAQTIASEDLRLEFAIAAYPNTVDPENYYEVYDAFQSFSKVFRLHDRVSQHPPGPTPPVVVAPAALGEEDFGQMLRTIQAEPFDNTKLATARQLVASARGRIASRQVREILKSFAFEDRRLELGKAAYECVSDPWNYSVVYDTFTFPTSRETLARYLETRTPAAVPPRDDHRQGVSQ